MKRQGMNKVPKTSTTMLRQISGAAEHPRWAEFVARYRPMMVGFMRDRFPGLEAEDVIQETLVSLMEALPNYVLLDGEKGAFHNFLIGVLRHKALDGVRDEERRKRLERKHLEGVEAERGEENESAWRETVYAAALEQLLADPSINARHKQMFVRTALKGEKSADVAASLLSTRSAVDKAKERMIERLKDLVERLERVDGR